MATWYLTLTLISHFDIDISHWYLTLTLISHFGVVWYLTLTDWLFPVVIKSACSVPAVTIRGTSKGGVLLSIPFTIPVQPLSRGTFGKNTCWAAMKKETSLWNWFFQKDVFFRGISWHRDKEIIKSSFDVPCSIRRSSISAANVSSLWWRNCFSKHFSLFSLLLVFLC